jgi:hypothetical protein
MKNWFFEIIIVATALSVSQLCQAAVQSPSPQVTGFDQSIDPKIVAKAKEWFHRFQTGQIDRSQLNAQVNEQLTSAMIQQEAATLSRFGNPSSFQFLRTYEISGAVAYDFLLQFSAGRIVEMIAFGSDGKIAGIDFQTFVKTSASSDAPAAISARAYRNRTGGCEKGYGCQAGEAFSAFNVVSRNVCTIECDSVVQAAFTRRFGICFATGDVASARFDKRGAGLES